MKFHAMLAVTLLFGGSIAVAANPVVEIETTEGKIVLELDAQAAPKTVENFLKYVASGHYEGTVFHRVIDGFMIQGGGLTKDLKEKKTLAPVRNEAKNGLRNARYTIAMARKPDPHSATCQFFINTNDNRFLDRDRARDGYGYTVFGKVTAGKEVVDLIGKVPTQTVADPAHPGGLLENVPVNPIVFKSVKRIDEGAKKESTEEAAAAP